MLDKRYLFIAGLLANSVSILWLDSFVTYAYSCRNCLLEFFIIFKPKRIKNSNWQIRQLYGYVANESTLCVDCF